LALRNRDATVCFVSRTGHPRWRSVRSRRRRLSRRRLTQLLLACLGLLPLTYPLAQEQTAGVVVSQGPAAAVARDVGVTGEPPAAASPTVAEPPVAAVPEDQAVGGTQALAQAQAQARAQDMAPAAGARSGPAAEAPAATGTPSAAPAPAAPKAPKPTTAPPVRATTAPAASGDALSWGPPAGWENYPVTRITSTTSVTTVGARGGDVLVQLDPNRPVAPIIIANCRNAVVMGGQINVLPTARIGTDDQRAIYVHKCTGTVHVEGVLINGAVAGSQSDGIAVNAPEATVQIQNVRMEGLRGTYTVNHADVFQPWGGVREYRIDRLSGSTNYQGIQVRRDLGAIGRGTIRNADVASSGVTPIDRGGHFIRVDCNSYPLTLDNVYIAQREGRPLGMSVWPQTDDKSCPAVVSGGVASWPSIPSVSGGVREGRPAAGDFVPAGSVGLGYVSPGYR
jgi:hypothetical protein